MIFSIRSDFGTCLVGIFNWRAIACKFISVLGLRDRGRFCRSCSVQIEFLESAIAVGVAVFVIVCRCCTVVCWVYMCVTVGWLMCCGDPASPCHYLVGHLAQFLIVFPYDEHIREFADIFIKFLISYLILILEQVP